MADDDDVSHTHTKKERKKPEVLKSFDLIKVNLIPSLARHLEIFPFFCIYTIFLKRINQSNQMK